MTRLSDKEFRAMNRTPRQWLQRYWEFPILKRFGIPITGRDVLEVGCGSGYGAQLLATLEPSSYTGFDFMEEQLSLARKRLPDLNFLQQDAANMQAIATASIDTVVVFGVLHHIPEWKAALGEIARVLRPGGEVYLEEPDGSVLEWFDRHFKWGHPVFFRLKDLETCAQEMGFEILRRSYSFGFGFYRMKKG
jgi:ubiquinone/menaquinone biosynthesis C-methylase UbiE